MLYYLKKTWKESLLTVLCQITAYGVEVFAALTSMVMLDGLLEQSPRKFIWGLLTHLMIWAVSFLASHLETVFHYQAMRRINALERKDMTAALMKKNHQQFHTQESGTYLSSFTNDVAQMEQLGWEPFFGLFGITAQILSSLVALYCLHWSLMATSILLALAMILLPKLFDRRLKEAGETCSRLQGQAVSLFKDLMGGFDVLQFFGQGKRLISGTEEASKQMEMPRYRLYVLKSAVSNGMGFLSVVFQVVIRLLAGVLILMGILNVSVMVSVGTICSNVYNGLKQFVSLQLSFSASKPYFDKITVHAGEVSQPESRLPALQQGITVEDVSFCYDENKPVLVHMDAQFKKGGKYALTGPSGCGKSTLLKILLGWLPEYRGTVRYDGQDVRAFTPEQLQQQMSYIEQDVFLFNTTIRENITLGETFTEEQLEKALRDSALAGDLAQMPQGLDTPVGEEGSALSGGQKQRVAIARALIHDRSILLVDEGTSALDQKNADIVEKSLLSNPDLTLILISHHLSEQRKAQFDHVYQLTPACAECETL